MTCAAVELHKARQYQWFDAGRENLFLNDSETKSTILRCGKVMYCCHVLYTEILWSFSPTAAEQRIHQQKDTHHRDGHRCRQSNSNRHLRNPMPEVGVGYESCREGRRWKQTSKQVWNPAANRFTWKIFWRIQVFPNSEYPTIKVLIHRFKQTLKHDRCCTLKCVCQDDHTRSDDAHGNVEHTATAREHVEQCKL